MNEKYILNTDENKKRDGFKGEQLIVIPIEAFQNYIKHPQVKRLYLTDIGFSHMLFIIIENVKKVFLNIYFSIVQREKVLYLLMEKIIH